MLRVIRVGWFAFEGFGRPYEGWRRHRHAGWQCAGRAFTRIGAVRKAQRLPELKDLPDFKVTAGTLPISDTNAAGPAPRGATHTA